MTPDELLDRVKAYGTSARDIEQCYNGYRNYKNNFGIIGGATLCML